MSVERALSRVEADLAQGHTHVAVQRLTTLVQQNPWDLTLRDRLAAVQLSTGNLVEAGRWSFLTNDERDPAAAAAFDRAFPHPRARRDALRLRIPTSRLPPGAGRDRMFALEAESRAAGRMVQTRRDPWGDDDETGPVTWRRALGGLLGTAFGALVLTTFVVGAVTLVRWVF